MGDDHKKLTTDAVKIVKYHDLLHVAFYGTSRDDLTFNLRLSLFLNFLRSILRDLVFRAAECVIARTA